MTAHDVDTLKATAARFEALLVPIRQTAHSANAIAQLTTDPSVGGIADLLTRGDPALTVDAIDQLAGALIPPQDIAADQLAAYVYLAAARIVMGRPQIAEAVADLESDLMAEGAEAFHNDEIFMQALGAALLPLAGLDVEATFHFTRLFMENFPSFSMPLGDYDLRATRWLAQLMDIGATRAGYRERFGDLARAAENDAPLAAARLRAWVEGRPPADQTEDVLWMQGLLALARSQL